MKLLLLTQLIQLLQIISPAVSFTVSFDPPTRSFQITTRSHPPLCSTRLKATTSKQQQLGEFETLNTQANNAFKGIDRSVQLYDFSGSNPIEYRSMWEVQKSLVGAHVNRLKVEFQKIAPDTQFMDTDQLQLGASSSSSSVVGISDYMMIPEQEERIKSFDSLILLQHQPVYTLGTGSDSQFVKLDEERLESLGIDLIRIDRGGEVTYHGPGQLTAYPIFDLRGYKQDIHWYMRALEEAILIALENAGVQGAVREDNVTGVWMNGKKVAALGVKVKRWVTMHGLAVNVDHRSLGNFDGIVPCGLEGRDVGCVNDFLDEPITVEEFAVHLKQALEQVFEIKLKS
jgi:lipoyl(octanoyl) transferase